jgi:hypothetical protein
MRKQMGYLLVDHSASPGLPEAVARSAGYDPVWCREGKRFETATLTCSHCQSCVVPNHFRIRERAHCMKCNHYICDACHYLTTLPDYVHFPFAAVVDGTVKLGDPTITRMGSPEKLLNLKEGN